MRTTSIIKATSVWLTTIVQCWDTLEGRTSECKSESAHESYHSCSFSYMFHDQDSDNDMSIN